MTGNKYNYLFVSDMHVAEGYDQAKSSYSPREDFIYDEEFSNFLHYMDEHREGQEEEGKPWELVIVGDGLDFLPVEIGATRESEDLYRGVFDSLLEKDPEKRPASWYRFLNEPFNPARIRLMILEWFLKKKLIVTALGPARLRDINPEVQSMPEEWHEWSVLPDELIGDFLQRHFELAERERAQKDHLIPVIKVNQMNNFASRLGTRLTSSLFWKRRIRRAREEFLTTEEGAVQKLKIIARGHPILFESFAWWVSRGHRLVVMPGNHDLELRWPRVQEELKAILLEICRKNRWDETDFPSRVETHYTWFYLKPGLFYAEHGEQYDVLNGAPNIFEPFEPDFNTGTPRRVSLPYGGLGVWMLVGRLEDEFPQFEILGDHSGAILQLLKKYPFKMIKIIAQNVQQYAEIGWRSLLGTTGSSTGRQILHSFQLAIIGFLFWLTHRLWRHIVRILYPVVAGLLDLITLVVRDYDRFSGVKFRLRETATNVQYFPTGRQREILCKLVGLNLGDADKIYEAWYPTPGQFRSYGERFGLDEGTVKRIYDRWDQPVTLYRIPMFIYMVLFTVVGYLLNIINQLARGFLWMFNPLGGLVPLVAILSILWFNNPGFNFFGFLRSFAVDARALFFDVLPNGKQTEEFLNSPSAQNTALFLLGAVVLMFSIGFTELMKRLRGYLDIKFFNYFIDQEDYILEGARGVKTVLEEYTNRTSLGDDKEGRDDWSSGVMYPPRFYIMGHDHRPTRHRFINNDLFLFKQNAEYYNTGSWLPWFADQDLRRMRTGGLDNEFTFLKIHDGKSQRVRDDSFSWDNADYSAEFLRWNDAAGRPQEQIVIHRSEAEEKTRLFGGWIGIGITIAILLAIVSDQTAGLLGYTAIGGLLGYIIQLIASRLASRTADYYRY